MKLRILAMIGFALGLAPFGTDAETLSTLGTPGLIDMPTA